MKYKLTKTYIKYADKTVYQIEALENFGYVKAGDLGGYIENESNLSQEDSCWAFEGTRIYDNAVVRGFARIYGYAEVSGYAVVCGNAVVSSEAKVSGNAVVSGNAEVSGNAVVCGFAKIGSDCIIN